MVTHPWWNSTVAADFKRKVNRLVRTNLVGDQSVFVNGMHALVIANGDMSDLGLPDEWVPTSKQINYVSALYRQHCTESLER